jgi:peptidoglycan-associated lipoprotein
MRIPGFIYCLILGLLLSTQTEAQKKSKTDVADKAFSRAEYFNAIALYKKAYAKEKNKAVKAEILFKTAESYRMVNDMKEAESWYEKAVASNYPDPIAKFRLAQTVKANGRYADAIVKFNEYKTSAPSDSRAQEAIQSCETAQGWKDKPLRIKVENVTPLNTKFSDFAASYRTADYASIIFTSNRQESMGRSTDGWTGQKFSDLYEATRDAIGKWSTPKPLSAPVNSVLNEGTAILDKTGNVMFFTRCFIEKNRPGVCKIFITRKKGDAWEDPKSLPFNSDTFTVGHPSISADGTKLYFSSDMTGGFGGKDIWMSSYDKASDAWGKPVNMGSVINTASDEMYPFINDNGSLYFASNGHPGMGGLDNFRSPAEGAGFGKPQNLKYPMNSSADDFGIVFAGSSEKGYFTSNREGTIGGDDIYSFEGIPLYFTVAGRVYDADTKVSLTGAKVELFGSDGSNLTYTTVGDGMYKYELNEETSYTITASLTGYLSKSIKLSTVGLEESKDFVHDFDFALPPISKPILLPEIYYDFDMATLRPESKKELDGLITTLTENPNITIRLVSHTDARGGHAYNMSLSNRRAKSVVDYLIAQGIDAERLQFEGRGKTQFKVSESEIAKLGSEDEREAAHQLNRRTEFEVLRTDYVPGKKQP